MMNNRARYIMIGGFLGAGKTTAILKLAQQLEAQGKTVGLITNDQASGLVDTQMALASRFPVEEIAGGCFCCRFNSLVSASQQLTATSRPDVLIAEPVGSCTDLVATVSVPLRQLYGGDYIVAPLSVLVDPIRALCALGLGENQPFAAKVTYIYLKQLEEAHLLVINKADLLTSNQIATLRGALHERFPRSEVLVVSARQGTGLPAWFDRILGSELSATGIMEMDYITYGVGEAMLGWLNATLMVRAVLPVDGNELLQQFAMFLRDRLAAVPVELAHLKMTMSPTDKPFAIAVTNLVRTDMTPELSVRLADPIREGALTLNMRAQANPATLEQIVREVTDKLGVAGNMRVTVDRLQSFKPGQPNPTHRMDAAGLTHRPVLPAGVA